MSLQIGIDTGGTFTDAVLVDDERRVLATAKALTRHDDLVVGLGEALDAVLRDGRIDGEDTPITLVSLSTTLATNALVEGRGRPVGLILIGLPEERLGRARLAEALGGDPVVFAGGGHDASGAEREPLDEVALRRFVERHDHAVEAWAISALFSTRNPEHERRAQAIVAATGTRPVSLGHSLSAGLDAPRRALTALLNARLVPLIGELLEAAGTLLRERGIAAPLMVVKGDGSLIGAAVAAACPVETILSGPAASLVGASFLCDEPHLLVADTGGTTTDIAQLVAGRPKLAPDGAVVGGWRTMVRAVDVRTVALGGDGELGPGFDAEAGGGAEAGAGSSRSLRLGRRRVVPLGRLADEYPGTLDILAAQLAAPRASEHDGRFAIRCRTATPAALARLGSPERALYERLAGGPLAVTALFAERSRERALERLEEANLVQLAAFTPSDASRLAGSHAGGNREAAERGARLLMRRMALVGPGGRDGHDVELFARAACRHVSERIALALADAVCTERVPIGGRGGADGGSDGTSGGLTASQRRLVARGFRSGGTSPLTVSLRLGMPVVGLGAPAASYHGTAAELLGTEVRLPAHGPVANALGAVVGLVRQEVTVTLTDAGGGSVRVLLGGGPVVCAALEEGVRLAEREARELAAARATAAGVGEATIELRREDVVVNRDGARTFLECRVSAIATGRPASADAERSAR